MAMNVLQTLCLESLDFSAFKAIHLFNVLIIVGADGIATSTSSRNFSLRVYSLLMALLAGTVCIVSYFMLVEDLRSYVWANRWVTLFAKFFVQGIAYLMIFDLRPSRQVM